VPILVDTGPLVALADADDPYHRAVLTAVQSTAEALLVPVTVVPEVDYLVTRDFGPAAALAIIQALEAGEFMLEQLAPGDLARCAELLTQYTDSDIGLVDASIVAIAERLRITRILTLDQRHFRMIRPKHCTAFELLPAPDFR
jgi:predicted nucleic acid-binding protein